LKNIEKMKGEEFLNQEALLRLARSKLLEIADDMAGGSRWGTDRGVAPAPRNRNIWCLGFTSAFLNRGYFRKKTDAKKNCLFR